MSTTYHPMHHPDDAMLLAYAAGALDTPWELPVAVHLALCPKCRAAVAAFEEAGGQTLEDEAPLAMDMSVDPAALIARAEAAGPEPAPAPANDTGATPVFPQPLRALAGDLAEVRWSPLAPGMRQKVLMRQGGVSARLLYFAPGATVAEHGHKGQEITTVLSGGYFDGDQAYSRGDMQVVAEDVMHRPTAMLDQPCVCLAVTDGSLLFRDWGARLVQLFARI